MCTKRLGNEASLAKSRPTYHLRRLYHDNCISATCRPPAHLHSYCIERLTQFICLGNQRPRFEVSSTCNPGLKILQVGTWWPSKPEGAEVAMRGVGAAFEQHVRTWKRLTIWPEHPHRVARNYPRFGCDCPPKLARAQIYSSSESDWMINLLYHGALSS
jgi:hypothetical protein